LLVAATPTATPTLHTALTVCCICWYVEPGLPQYWIACAVHADLLFCLLRCIV
jgi:hypothetical protein